MFILSATISPLASILSFKMKSKDTHSKIIFTCQLSAYIWIRSYEEAFD